MIPGVCLIRRLKKKKRGAFTWYGGSTGQRSGCLFDSVKYDER